MIISRPTRKSNEQQSRQPTNVESSPEEKKEQEDPHEEDGNTRRGLIARAPAVPEEAFVDAQDSVDDDIVGDEAASSSSSDQDGNSNAAERGETAQQNATTPNNNNSEGNNKNNNNSSSHGANEHPPHPQHQPALYKSSRFKGYLTILLGSIIYYDAAQKSRNAFAAATVPATDRQKAFALSVSIVSLGLSGGALGAHLDQITPLQNLWKRAFRPKSRVELFLALVLFCWWATAVGQQTSVQGLAGDGKGQYSLYYSAWVCLYSAFFDVLEPWWVAAGWSSLQAFVQSWPFRSPGWLCLLSFAILDLVWILDLWRNYPELRDRQETLFIYYYIEAVPTGQWQFLISLSVFTIAASAAWVLVELFRTTGVLKDRFEVIAEGISILVLLLLWIPSIMLITTSGGLASLVGNAYFFSWFVVIFLAETAVWFVHDLREGMWTSLQDKAQAYRDHQRSVLEKQQTFLRQQSDKRFARRQEEDNDDDEDERSSIAAPEFFDALSEF